MAGTEDRDLTSVAEAKSRLRELGAEKRPANPLRSPVVLAGALLAAGVILSRIGPRRRNGLAGSLVKAAARAGMAAAPLLVDQFVRRVLAQDGARGGAHEARPADRAARR